MRPPERTVRRAAIPLAGAALFVAVISVMYSGLLGFGVNERCDTMAPSGSDCDRLNWMALIHAGAQVVLAIAAGVAVAYVMSATARGRRRNGLIVVVAFVYVCVVASAAVIYTNAAWDWADSFG